MIAIVIFTGMITSPINRFAALTEEITQSERDTPNESALHRATKSAGLPAVSILCSATSNPP